LNDTGPDEGGAEKPIDSGIPAQDRGDQIETLDILQKALSGLRDEHRSAIVLKEYVGLSLEELADVMECPLSTAKSRLYHGLKDVQRNLRRIGIKSR
jgi:DNA-directed RNA polymerase specialized sigma24 family protein